MNEQFFLPIHTLAITYSFYLKNNHDTKQFFESCNITPGDFLNEQHKVPLNSFLISLRLLNKLKPENKSLLEIMNLYLPISGLGRFGFTLISAPTVNCGLEFLVDNSNVVIPTLIMKWIKPQNKNQKIIQLSSLNCHMEFENEILDVMCIKIIDYISLCCNEVQLLPTVYENMQKSEAIFVDNCVQIKKAGSLRQILIDLNVLNNNSPMAHSGFFHTNKNEIEVKSLKINSNNWYTTQTTRIINNKICSNIKPKLSSVAEELSVSPKTLSRMLKKEGGSFQLLIDNETCKQAKEYLSTKFTIKEITYLLGFKSIAGLNNVFIRNYGVSMSQYRKELSCLY